MNTPVKEILSYSSSEEVDVVTHSEDTPITTLASRSAKSTAFLENQEIHTVEQFASMNDETYDKFVKLHLSSNSNLRRAVNILRQATKLMMFERMDQLTPLLMPLRFLILSQ